jgi:hypothetical protein
VLERHDAAEAPQRGWRDADGLVAGRVDGALGREPERGAGRPADQGLDQRERAGEPGGDRGVSAEGRLAEPEERQHAPGAGAGGGCGGCGGCDRVERGLAGVGLDRGALDGGAGGGERGARGVDRGGDGGRLLRLEFYEVQLDAPVEASKFVFRAEHLHFVDITDRVLAEREKMQR